MTTMPTESAVPAKRKRGRPPGPGLKKVDSVKRYQQILEVTRAATATVPQTIRHAYYLCSGQGIVGKDHAGGPRSNEHIVNQAISKARWSGDLSWDSIIDGTREADMPVYWDDGQSFL